MNNISITLPQVQIFILVFIRVAGIIMSVPVLNSREIPILFKMGLSLSFAFLLFEQRDLVGTCSSLSTIPFCIGIAGEILIGLIIGLAIQLVFAGIMLGGQIIGFQMGFSFVNVMDPMTNTQVSVTARLNNLMAILIFIAINAHHLFIRVIADSFKIVPPLGFEFSHSLISRLVMLSGNVFVIGIKVAAPVMGVLLLTSFSLGLLARMSPQLNVFIVAMPLNIVIGLVMMGISAPLVVAFFIREFHKLVPVLMALLRAMAGPVSP